MSYKIIRDKDFLHKKTNPVSTVGEGTEIAIQLLSVLDEMKFGVGLSANQIGILKSVSVVRVRKDKPAIILMNPNVIEASKEKLIYVEGCLSLPGKQTKTVRNMKVTVSTLNHANPLSFGPDTEPMTDLTVGGDFGVLETVCVQHEIDHLNGVLMTDDGVRFNPVVEKKIKYGRNDKVVVEKNGETQYLKYKRALELLTDGWKII
jgi:peptide deformylase